MARSFRPVAKLERSSQGNRLPKPKIVIVCEGKKTEPTYFEDFKKSHSNGLVEVESIGGCGVPISVVERAIEERKQLQAKARKSRDSFDLFFEVWAVFDRDEHPVGQVPRALELAASNAIKIAYSNPCFEVWGLMHYKCCARPGHHHDTQSELKSLLKDYCHDTNPIFSLQILSPMYFDAVRNASRALAQREQEGHPSGDPSTTVHLLTERIREGPL